MNVWTTMQHSSEMILFIIFYFILRVDCHLAVSCGKWEPICCCQIPLMSYVTPLSNGQISFLTRWQFYPFILDFLPFCMKLGMVDTSRNQFLWTFWTIKASQKFFHVQCMSSWKLWKLLIFMTMILRPSFDGNFVPHWNWTACLVWTRVRCTCVED